MNKKKIDIITPDLPLMELQDKIKVFLASLKG